MKNGFYTRIYKKAFVFAVVLLVFGIAFALASSIRTKAATQYLEDISEYVLNDWENYQTDTKNGITITNQNDGTLQINGTASATTDFVLPMKSWQRTSYDIFIALMINNVLQTNPNANGTITTARLYLAYNNGANITSTYANGMGWYSVSEFSPGSTYQTYCLVLRIAQNATFNNDILTPFILAIPSTEHTYPQASFSDLTAFAINSLLGPEMQGAPDLTKVNYIQEATNISLVISSQINKSFGNELEEIIQYSFTAGDTIQVDTTGVATTTIDLLTMSDGTHTYKMTFVNDALSNDYLNIFLYKDNNATLFYNDNLGELSAQNITNFRMWGVDAINNNATITGGSATNNDIIGKIYVYSSGTNYDTGYQAGYNDARADVETELQEAWADGLQQGYEDGYTTGYGEGYDQGAIEGIDSSWLINLFGTIDTFFSIHLFPNLTIGTLFAIPFVLSIAWVIIRILRGGGYGD